MNGNLSINVDAEDNIVKPNTATPDALNPTQEELTIPESISNSENCIMINSNQSGYNSLNLNENVLDDLYHSDNLVGSEALDDSIILNSSAVLDNIEVNANHDVSLNNLKVMDYMENLPILDDKSSLSSLENKENLENCSRAKLAFKMGVYTARASPPIKVHAC